MSMKRLLLGVLLLAAFVISACGKKSGNELGTVEGKVAGVKWSVPARWTVGAERPMRVVTYVVPAKDGSGEPADCAISYFGAGQGGVVGANIDRWVGQFEPPTPPEQSVREVNGMKVTTVHLSGTYIGMGGMMMESAPKKEDYRLLGAIVEAPEGMIFFKMTGPRKTVTDAEKEFDAMLGSLTK